MFETDASRVLIRRQHGIVTREQAVACGLSRRQIEHRLATGEWVAVCRGVYRIATHLLTYESKALAACLHAGPDAVASHTTAAVLLGFEDVRAGRIEITVPHGTRTRSPLAVVHQSLYLPREDVRRVNGVRCTKAARTICDLAARLSIGEVVEVVDGTLVDRHVKLDSILATLARLETSPGRPGTAALRSVLAMWDDGRPLPESRGETRLVRELIRRGFPPPERQFEVWAGDRRLGRADLAYPPQRVVLEYYGVRRHLDPARARENDLVAAGWRVLTATKADLHPRARRFYAALAPLLASG